MGCPTNISFNDQPSCRRLPGANGLQQAVEVVGGLGGGEQRGHEDGRGGGGEGGGERAQERVGGGAELGEGDERVVMGGEVGAFVGQQDAALGVVEGVEHAGGDDDPAGEPGQSVGVGCLVLDDDRAVAGG